MPNSGFINLLPLDEKPLPNVGETYLRARAMADQNALAQQSQEMNALNIQNYKENKGTTNALVKANARLKTMKYLNVRSNMYNSIWDDAIKNKKTPEEAMAIVQPLYEQDMSIADAAGISYSKKFDRVASDAFVKATSNLNNKSGGVIWGTDPNTGEDIPYQVGNGNALQIPGVSKKPKKTKDTQTDRDRIERAATWSKELRVDITPLESDEILRRSNEKSPLGDSIGLQKAKNEFALRKKRGSGNAGSSEKPKPVF